MTHYRDWKYWAIVAVWGFLAGAAGAEVVNVFLRAGNC